MTEQCDRCGADMPPHIERDHDLQQLTCPGCADAHDAEPRDGESYNKHGSIRPVPPHVGHPAEQ